MELSKTRIAERARTIWATNGMLSDTELDDWRPAAEELRHAEALARQLDKSPSPEISQLLQAVLDFSPAVISVKDTRGRYLVVNTRFASLYQLSQNRLHDTTDYDLFPTDQADALRANDLDVIATWRSLEFEEVIRDPQESGVDRTYLSLKFPIAGPNGCPYAVGAISTDITERKRDHRCMLIQHAVTRALVEAATYSDAEPAILQAICTALGWDVGLLWYVDPAAHLLRCVEVWNASDLVIKAFEQMSRGMTLSSGVGLPGRVWDTGRPIWIHNIVEVDSFPRAAMALDDGMHGACAFPIRNGGGVLGVIEFFSHEIQRPDSELQQVMDGIGSQIGQFMERRRAERTLHERAREFELARTIQLGLLPRASPILRGFAIEGASHPALETGGDYFDFMTMADGSLGIAIGDASGHGIGAALVIAETRAYLRARAATDLDIGRLLTLVNRQLCADLPTDNFVTLLFAGLDEANSTLTYSGAGHWPGYVLDNLGRVRELLGSTNIPLGIDPNSYYSVAPQVVLRPDETVLLLTDGILEASSPDGAMYGAERALDVVRACRSDTPGDIIAALLASVYAFSPGSRADDMTVVILKAESVRA